MAKINAGKASDMPPNSITKLENADVSVANVNGEFYAITDTCTHAGASMANGKIDGTTQPPFRSLNEVSSNVAQTWLALVSQTVSIHLQFDWHYVNGDNMPLRIFTYSKLFDKSFNET